MKSAIKKKEEMTWGRKLFIKKYSQKEDKNSEL